MILEYAPKGLIGVLTPQANTTVEPEFHVLLPPETAFLNARLVSPKATIEERLADYRDHLDDALHQFGNAPVQAIALGTTGISYLCGKEMEAELVAQLEAKLGVRFVTGGLAVVDSLRALAATRIGLVSPYPKSLTAASVAYWRAHGFDIGEVAEPATDAATFHPIYSLNGRAAAAALATLADKKLDAIVMLGTGMPTLAPIAAAIGWRGAPVTSCVLSLAWATLEAAARRPPSRASLERWLAGDGWVDRLRTRHPSAMLPRL